MKSYAIFAVPDVETPILTQMTLLSPTVMQLNAPEKFPLVPHVRMISKVEISSSGAFHTHPLQFSRHFTTRTAQNVGTRRSRQKPYDG